MATYCMFMPAHQALWISSYIIEHIIRSKIGWVQYRYNCRILFILFLPSVDLLSRSENELKTDLEINFEEYGTIVTVMYC